MLQLDYGIDCYLTNDMLRHRYLLINCTIETKFDRFYKQPIAPAVFHSVSSSDDLIKWLVIDGISYKW